jgi:hypothetical protein
VKETPDRLLVQVHGRIESSAFDDADHAWIAEETVNFARNIVGGRSRSTLADPLDLLWAIGEVLG